MHTLTSLHVDVRPCSHHPPYVYSLGSSGSGGGGGREVDASTVDGRYLTARFPGR